MGQEYSTEESHPFMTGEDEKNQNGIRYSVCKIVQIKGVLVQPRDSCNSCRKECDNEQREMQYDFFYGHRYKSMENEMPE